MSRVGSKRHLGVIYALVQAKDAMGGPTKQWAEFCKVWCSLIPIKGTERWYSDEKYATATHKVNIRYLHGIDPKMQLVARGRTFDIVSVTNIGERDKEMQLIVEEDANHD